MIGESIGSYRIVAKLGEGGMGAVYLGEHQRIARKAAIKVLLPELSNNQQVVARFFNEARATSLIRHPGIIEIIDCDVLPSGNAYIVMELLEGESLGSCLRSHGPLPMKRAQLLTRNIADALAAAHEQKIVHRDLKPDNVFVLTTDGAAPAQPIKILDFGIAKLIHTNPEGGQYKTRTGSIIGTPVYMSPEQCRGIGSVDHRTDIYALGCMLFEMLSGRPPFTSEGFGELIQSHLSVAPPALRSLDPKFPKPLEAFVARMLAKSPDDRPQTMQAVIAELDAITSNASTPRAAIAGAGPDRVRVPETLTPVGPLPARQMPRVQTTLESASSERLAVVSATGEPAAPKRGRRGILGAVAVVALVAGGFGIWRVTTHGLSGPWDGSVVRTGTPAPPTTATQAVPAAAAPPQLPPQPQPQPQPQPPPVHVPPPVPPPSVATTSTPGPRKVKVVITSDPSSADVCLQNDRSLLGRTQLTWSAQKSRQPIKLLIRKRGYRGQELSIVPEHDARRTVTLDKLGPDDIDDTENCKSQ